jgi:lipoprotein-anchoring transpeptidase ErfK/SrfK
MLDRAGFSPGALDGKMGGNTRKALEQYQKQATASPAAVEPLTGYSITAADVAGPFVPIPADLVQQATLSALTYTSALEALAERFHSTPALLQQLNPGAEFKEGEQIQVPNVEPLIPPVEKPEPSPEALAAAEKERVARPAGTTGRRGSPPPRQPNTVAMRPDVTVTVSRAASALTVADASGQTIFYAPVTTGSAHDPLPIGEWKVTGVQFNPSFNYNPELFWDADPSHAKAKLPSGPNNPVGLVWIDLSKEHYGIHGTPEPSTIGRTESHGCVRLTNWDALKLAGMVKPGTRVVFSE